MLNVLLSFAQYEREISAERVRDKIAASKKLGYGMGGYAPLGYDAKDRSLIINPKEAENVRYIYDKFLELKSITRLLMDIQTQEIHTKNGRNFSKKTLRQILTNPIYKGYISHKGVEYKGRHEVIIDEIRFKEIQDIFRKDSKERIFQPSNALLKDLIRCELCDCAMTPTYCNRHHRKYRYYTCSSHLRKKSCTSENKILPAGDVEEFVVKIVRKLLKDPAITTLTIHKLAFAES